jgi:UDP-glucose 4-epimerase
VRYFITGCAGFIGSTLTDRLLSDGHQVVGYDNLCTGQERFLLAARRSANFRLVRGDVLDAAFLCESMQGSQFVFHLAANADVRFGLEYPRRDLEQNTIATHCVLEAMRVNAIRHIAFTSSGSVYGESPIIPTPEDAPCPIQTSLYGASKMAAEGLIAAYCAGFDMQCHVFRLVSILGERYTHGHVFDFYRQLIRDGSRLKVLGNGRQRKAYLYVQDCIEAMLSAIQCSNGRINIFNVGPDSFCELNDSIAWICDALGVTPAVEYAGGDQGWIGDNPFIFLDSGKLRALGWRPTLTIEQGVLKTVEYLRTNSDLLDMRT